LVIKLLVGNIYIYIYMYVYVYVYVYIYIYVYVYIYVYIFIYMLTRLYFGPHLIEILKFFTLADF
jgi:hypothetical protein